MKKRILHGVLAGTMSLSLAVPSLASTFEDVPETHWANGFVEYAVEGGLVSGAGDGNFYPDKAMTVGEFAVIIVNGGLHGEKMERDGDSHWSDVFLNTMLFHNMYHSSKYIRMIDVEAGWQEEAMTREDVATVISRLMNRGTFASGNMSLAYGFADLADSFSYRGEFYPVYRDGQVQDIVDVLANGIMGGTGEVFGCGESLTRAQACVIIKNMVEKGLLSKTTPHNHSSPTSL